MESIMRMHLFGTLTLENEDVRLDEQTLHSKRLTQLLAYILIYRDKPISHEELVFALWGGKTRNPQSALKNLMYRLRNALRALGDEEYICTLPGAYRWNPRIQVKTDYEEFEENVQAVRSERDTERKKQLCQKVIASYHGNISEKLGTDSWILSKTVRYRFLFMEVVKALGRIYEEEEAWESLDQLCHEALTADQLDEDLHYWIMKSLWKQNKSDLAVTYYEEIRKLIFDSLGIHAAEKLEALFQEIAAELEEKTVKDIRDLMSEMEEKERNPNGAFFCDYQTFRQIYRVEARRFSRMEMSEMVLLLTVRSAGETPQEQGTDSGVAEGMVCLEKQLKNLLRMGDLAVRYRGNQYIILLPGCSRTSGIIVAERIRRGFSDYAENHKLLLEYQLEKLSSEKIARLAGADEPVAGRQ